MARGPDPLAGQTPTGPRKGGGDFFGNLINRYLGGLSHTWPVGEWLPQDGKKKTAGGQPAAPASQTNQNQQNAPPQQQTSPTFFDPLGMQSIFANVIAPYLSNVANSYQSDINQYGQNLNAALQRPMDPGIKNAMAAMIPQEQLAMTNENKALVGLSQAQPEFNMLLNQLNTARQAAYSAAKYYSQSGQLTSAGLPTQLNLQGASPLLQQQLKTLGVVP